MCTKKEKMITLSYLRYILLASTFAGESGFGSSSRLLMLRSTFATDREGRQLIKTELPPGIAFPSFRILNTFHNEHT